MNSSSGGPRAAGRRLGSRMQSTCAVAAAAFLVALPASDAGAAQSSAAFTVSITLRTLPESCSLAASNRSAFVRIVCNSATGVIDMQAPVVSLTAQAPLVALSTPGVLATGAVAAIVGSASPEPTEAVSALPVFTRSDSAAAVELLRGNSSEANRESLLLLDGTRPRVPDKRDDGSPRENSSHTEGQELLRLIVDAGARGQSPSKFAEFTSRTVAVGGMEYLEMTVSW